MRTPRAQPSRRGIGATLVALAASLAAHAVLLLAVSGRDPGAPRPRRSAPWRWSCGRLPLDRRSWKRVRLVAVN